MFLQTNHSTAGVGCPLVMHTTDWPVAEPWWMSIRSTMTAGTVMQARRRRVKHKLGFTTMGVKALRAAIVHDLTFDLQEQFHTLGPISILHLQGVVPTVLVLGSDQRQNTQVAGGTVTISMLANG